MNRRAVLAGASVLGGHGAQKLAADGYSHGATALRRPRDVTATDDARLGEVLRYRGLAPINYPLRPSLEMTNAS